MKTIIYIITITLSLSFTSLYAGNGENPVMVSTNSTRDMSIISQLAPSIPGVAPFDELLPEEVNVTSFLIWALAPETPGEADFSDEGKSESTLLSDLTPIIPNEADYSDNL